MKFFVTRKRMIKEFAKQIATIQAAADKAYYKPHLKNYIPEPNGNNHSAWLVENVFPLKKMCQDLGIVKQVYEEAYKIYDFRNSGREGFMLKDGKIVRI